MSVFTAFRVPGIPIPQGSMRAIRSGRNGALVMLSDNDKLSSWRGDVRDAALRAIAPGPYPKAPRGEPVRVGVTFHLPRIKAHFTPKGELRDYAPSYPTTKPDLDKLVRAILDAMTGVVYYDDAQVATIEAGKLYDTHWTGALVVVTDMVEDAIPRAFEEVTA